MNAVKHLIIIFIITRINTITQLDINFDVNNTVGYTVSVFVTDKHILTFTQFGNGWDLNWHFSLIISFVCSKIYPMRIHNS